MGTKYITGRMLLACTFGTTDVQKISNYLNGKKGKRLTHEQRKNLSIAWRKKLN